MKRFHPSPALVISLIALFVALGGTSYAAINALPKNSVGTKQLKNGAVTAAKLAYGQTLPSGKTETGDWGFGSKADATAGADARTVFSFPVPLASSIPEAKVFFVSGASAPHCPGAGHADAGYLCVYKDVLVNASTPDSVNLFNPVTDAGGADKGGFAIFLKTTGTGDWFISGNWAVTAP